jgi:hypothetical protein
MNRGADEQMKVEMPKDPGDFMKTLILLRTHLLNGSVLV